jgi:cytoskeletal protein CcmA (bactofilin family)
VWQDSNNWSGGNVPGASAEVHFSQNAYVILSGPASVASLDVHATSWPPPVVSLNPETYAAVIPVTVAGDVGVGLISDPGIGGHANFAVWSNVRLDVGGDVLVASGFPLVTSGTMQVTGEVNVDGAVRVRPSGMLEIKAGVVRGEVRLENRARLVGAWNFGGTQDTVDGDVWAQDSSIETGSHPFVITGDVTMSKSTDPMLAFEPYVTVGVYSPTEIGRLVVEGDFKPAGTFGLSTWFSFPGYQAGQSFDVLDFDPARLHGTFDQLSMPSLPQGLSWDVSQLYSTGVVSVVPEPSCAIAAVGALAALGRPAKRRRR